MRALHSLLKGLLPGSLHSLLIELLIAVPLATCGAVLCAAQDATPAETPPANTQPETSQLHGKECVHLSMQAAHLALENANRLFESGDAKAAHLAIDATLTNALQSVECSLHARRSQKSEEIDLRELIRRIKDLSQTLDVEDRPHLAQVSNKLEEQHDRLLQAIFGGALGGTTAEKKP